MKRIIDRIILMMGICLIVQVGLARGSGLGKIAGTVVGEETEQGIPGVEIVLQGELSATTDDNGDYFVVGVPAGDYHLIAHLAGYIPVEVKEVTVAPNLTTRVDLLLVAAANTDEDTIFGGRTVGQEENVTSLVVRASEVRRRSLERVIADQPGVIEVGSRLHRDLHLRGGYDDDITYFLDGRRIYDPSLISRDVIGRVYLTKGRFSPEYGDAASGVVDVVTKDAGTDWNGNIEWTTDRLPAWSYDFGHDGLNLTLGGPVPGPKNLSFLISGDLLYAREYELSRENADDYYESLLEKGNLAPLPHNDLRQKSGMAKLSWNPWAPVDVVLHASGAHTKYHRYSHSFLYGDWLRDQPLHDDRTSQIDLSINHRVNSRTSYRVGISKFDSHLNSAAQDGRHYNDWRTITDQLAWVAYARHWERGWYDEAFRTWNLPPEISRRYETHGYTDPEEIAWMYYYEFEEPKGHLDAETGEWVWDGASSIEKLKNAWQALNDRYHQVNTWQFLIDEDGDTLDLYYHEFDLDQYLDDVRRHLEGDTNITTSDFEPSGNIYRIRYSNMWYPGDWYFDYHFPASWYDSDVTCYGFDFSLTSQICSSHEIKMGADLKRHQAKLKDVRFVNENPYVNAYDMSPLTVSAYLQDKIERGRVTAVGGLRYDYVQSIWNQSINSGYPWETTQGRSTASSHRWSPRFSIRIIPSDNLLLNWSYGHFYPVTPFLNQMDKTILYNLGLEYTIIPPLSVAINLHRKDEKSEGDSSFFWVSPGGTEYTIFVVEQETNSQGLDLLVEASASEHLSATAGYSYLHARGSRSYYSRYVREEDTRSSDASLEVDGIHSVKVDIDISSPGTFGPSLGPWRPLSDVNVNLRHTFQSGRLNTPTDVRGNPMAPYSERMPPTQWTDLSIDKGFNVGGFRWGLFVDIFNLLNVENILAVHPTTGEPDDDGRRPEWDPAAYSSWEDYGYESTEDWYEDQLEKWALYAKDPRHYGTPRTIRVGVSAGF